MKKNSCVIRQKILKNFVNHPSRFNTIITSLKALDEGYSSKNYVRKFLRALHPKWREKVTTIEESKDLTSLSLNELIENLKINEMIIKKDSEIVKAKGERISLALKAKKKSSDEECSTFGSDDEEYVMAVRDFKKCGDPNHLIGECPKPLRDKNQRAFIGGSWRDSGEEDDEKVNDEHTSRLKHQMRGRLFTSSSSAFGQPSSSHLNDNDDDRNNKAALRASTPSPTHFVNSLTSEVPRVFQNPPNIDPDMEPFYTRHTEIINRQVQLRDEHHGGLWSIEKGFKNLWRNMKKK
nr:UBN2 domain-containing protein [Tanacetum cinerariifolium]